MGNGTALVTGASSGIGAEFARQLAASGHDLILVARRRDRLEAFCEELRNAHGIEAEALEADLSSDEDIDRVVARMHKTDDLVVLINNAGFGAGGHYSRLNEAKQVAMIRVHIVAVARLIRAALPDMEERKHGGIVNVASVAAFAGFARSAMYCSTKTWMVAFTKALALDLKGTGVHAQVLCPGYTFTEFHDTPEYANFERSDVPKIMWMSCERVVRISLRALERGRVIVVPGFINRVIVATLRSPLGWLVMLRASWKRR